jgi:hypothetical protein
MNIEPVRRSQRRPGGRAPKIVASVAVGVGILALLTACAGLAGPNNVANVDTDHISGFWAGLWQGLIMPISFVISLFTDSINIYDVHNSGNWYNFGFVLGAIVLPGGGARASRRR